MFGFAVLYFVIASVFFVCGCVCFMCGCMFFVCRAVFRAICVFGYVWAWFVCNWLGFLAYKGFPVFGGRYTR